MQAFSRNLKFERGDGTDRLSHHMKRQPLLYNFFSYFCATKHIFITLISRDLETKWVNNETLPQKLIII